jgi:hypothetical protein
MRCTTFTFSTASSLSAANLGTTPSAPLFVGVLLIRV